MEIMTEEELVKAAAEGLLDVVKVAIESHLLNVNCRGAMSMTPLHAAADKGHTSVVEFLTQHGADVNTLDTFGHTPIVTAAMNDHMPVLQFLVQHGFRCQSIGFPL